MSCISCYALSSYLSCFTCSLTLSSYWRVSSYVPEAREATLSRDRSRIGQRLQRRQYCYLKQALPKSTSGFLC
ncbi:hypothetical protein ASPVEDRAFT_522523 [Aspergillus versicolor CBS 583.65]|uniref:Uncharacterized protein n=1 Tax=Aspergillus versicolor CBS 583.65 TaxID=1036611 RepID=A0A1L9PDY8_ASPVE|nr:uncharacterized protein ASPVEDRAFT_522523 [Aspergillus versicolor CBS 583.65]OJI99664.1 hypothetical protein ASPVEDRAFT_522523 [Aspergillus versicolor CBS 583.65]